MTNSHVARSQRKCSDDTPWRRRLIGAISALFVADTLLTIWAIERGAVEANPLYWVFHDVHTGWQGVADAVGVRVILGLAMIYALYRDATLRMLRLILVGYGCVIGAMITGHAVAHFMASYPNLRWDLFTQQPGIVRAQVAVGLALIGGLGATALIRGRLRAR